MELMRAEVAQKLSTINRRKIVSEEMEEFVARRIKASVNKGMAEVAFDFKDTALSLKIANWVGQYGYRAYFDEKEYLHITWN